MVVKVKARFQKINRCFTVQDGVTISELKRKVIEIFPELQGTSPDSLILYCRDADDDVITISSDEELQTALGPLPSVGGKKAFAVQIGIQRTETRRREQRAIENEEAEIMDSLAQLLSELNQCHPAPNTSYDINPPLPQEPMFGTFPPSHCPLEHCSWQDQRKVLQERASYRRQREHDDRMFQRARRERERLLRRSEELEREKEEEGVLDRPLVPPRDLVKSTLRLEPIHRGSWALCKVWGLFQSQPEKSDEPRQEETVPLPGEQGRREVVVNTEETDQEESSSSPQNDNLQEQRKA